MKRWLIAALAVCGMCAMCSGGVLVLGLVGGDDGAAATGTATGGCSGTLAGWSQAITEQGVVLTKNGVTAELPWSFEFTDALRQGDSEANVLSVVLRSRYEPGQLARAGYGELYAAGPAKELSSGRTVYLAFTSGAQSGVANPVLVVGPDDSVLRAFPSSGALNALKDLNRFPLSCAEVEGRWKSGFSTAAERYAAGTGRFVGVEAVAAWRDLSLESGAYRRESSALLNGVFEKRVDSGDWSHDAWSLTLEPSGGEPIAFDAAYVAVQSGFLLRLQSKKFTGDIEEFARAE